MVHGVTFDNQLITSDNMAHFMYIFSGKRSGVSRGCALSNNAGSIFIGEGYFLVCGREVELIGSTEVKCPVATTDMFCSLIFEVDLNKTNTQKEFNQGAFRILTNEAGYPVVKKEDLDNGGKIYQMPFAEFKLSSSGISEFKDKRETFDAYFDQFSKVRYVKVLKDKWSSVAPYTQKIDVVGITEEDNPVYDLYIKDEVNAETGASLKEAYGYLDRLKTGNGSVTLYCYSDKPTVDFEIKLKGR